MKRAIVYIIIGIVGIFGFPYSLFLVIDTIPPLLYSILGFVGLIFYGLVLFIGLIRLVDELDSRR